MDELFDDDESSAESKGHGDRLVSLKTRERIRVDDPYFSDDYDPNSPVTGHLFKNEKPKKKRVFRIPRGDAQLRFLEKAIKKDAEETLEIGRHWQIARRMRPLRFSQRHQLRAMNPWAGKTWAAMIEQSLDELAARDGAYFSTVLCEEWDFETDQEWHNSDALMERVQTAQRTIRNHLRGLDFLFQLDVGLHRYAGSYGRRVCVHFHGIVWGPRAKVKAAMKRFGTGYSGARGGRATPVDGWERAVRYITKDTRATYVSFRRKTWSTDRRRPRLFNFREPQTRHHRRFLLGLFGRLTKPELCIASGRGVAVLRHARELAKDQGWVRSRR